MIKTIDEKVLSVIRCKDGCVAPVTNEDGSHGFHIVAFYEEFDGHLVVSSYRESDNANPYIRRILGKDTSTEEIDRICLDIVTSLLRKDVAREWYEDKEIVLDSSIDQTVRSYFQENIPFNRHHSYKLSQINYTLIPLE